MSDQIRPRSMLVVGAHSADFVWRSAGTVAVHTAAGGVATVVALSYGERGESGELWKEPGQTVENIKRIRHAEATQAAEAIGASFECFDLGDYPLNADNTALEHLTDLIREIEPDVIVTHAAKDPFNPDHPIAYVLTQRARLLASGAGVASSFKTIRPPEFFFFEPHQPELCEFQPNTFVDITAVFAKKRQAMAAMAAQKYLCQYYTEQAEHRAYHARRASGIEGIKYAEAFQRVLPQVVTQL